MQRQRTPVLNKKEMYYKLILSVITKLTDNVHRYLTIEKTYSLKLYIMTMTMTVKIGLVALKSTS